MKAVLKKSSTRHKTDGWTSKMQFNSNKLVARKDKNNVFVQQLRFTTSKKDLKPVRFSISSLRGKMTKQGAEELREQTKKLRKEWDRGF